jgi:3-oxoacyl-[acyl-carrier protein] reductase
MKIVVVTGTSKGLGEAIAISLLQENYLVIGISRGTSSAKLTQHVNFRQVTFDLLDSEKIPTLCFNIIQEHGIPYALVNNSAMGLDGLLATQNNDDIYMQISLNLTASILLTKYLSRSMLEKREGRIINISSVVASTGYKGLSVYAATKAAMLGFTRSLSRELGSRNITVNAIQPGFMATQMTQSISQENLERIMRRSSLSRLAEVEDVAGAIVFLLGDGGRNITGQSLIIDAGNSA